jgi:hypothetical protein
VSQLLLSRTHLSKPIIYDFFMVTKKLVPMLFYPDMTMLKYFKKAYLMFHKRQIWLEKI